MSKLRSLPRSTVEAAGGLTIDRTALRAIAVDLHVRHAHHVIEPVGVAAGLELPLLVIVGAARDAELGIRVGAGAFGGEADHSARRVAVHRGARAADHFDLLRRAEVDAVYGALAVRQRLRNSVDEHFDPANAELRARTETANRHAQILREVVAVLHEQTGDLRERLIERELLAPELDVVLGDDAHGRGHAVERAVDQRRGNDDLVERSLLRRVRLRGGGEREQGEGRERKDEAALPVICRHEIDWSWRDY